jgi:hypothetical protein
METPDLNIPGYDTGTKLDFTASSVNVITITPPILEGYWSPVRGTKIGTQRLPSRFHRFMMKFAFGWEFEKITKG